MNKAAKENHRVYNAPNAIRRTVMIIGMLVMISALLAGCGGQKPHTATLALSANPTTGYSWRAEQDPEIFDITSEYVEDAHDEEMVGVGGTETFTLLPKQEGTTEIKFYYEQPWEKGSVDTILTYQVAVDKYLQITVESQSGEVPGDESTVPELPEMVIE